MNADIYHLLVALLIGAVIGAEREYRNKSAGLRTMIMVSLASCLFTIMSIKIGVNNPDRLAANILTGLGFIGAGVIFKEENHISGITTATTIWMVAALGIATGAGYVLLSVLTAVVVLIVLILMIYIQDWIAELNMQRDYKIVCAYQQETLHHYEAVFKQFHMRIESGVQHKTETTITGHWFLQGRASNHKKLIEFLLNDPDVRELEY